jgi:RNA polymerase sigma-54 factor
MQLQRPSLIQSQKLTMNPQLYQSLQVMELPIIELRERIEEELEKNPALEILDDPSTVSLDNSLDNAAINKKEQYERFESTSDSGYVSSGGEAAADERQRFIEGALAHPESLQDHLLWQLRLEPVSEDIKRVSELLIQNLDADGFHIEPVEVLLKNEDAATIEKALKLVRGFDPVGTCTADYRESLRVQAELLPDAPSGILEALSCMDLLEQGKIKKAAKKIGCDVNHALYVFERLKELSPFPGRSFFAGTTRFVIPDVRVVKKDGEFVIILNEEEIPVLGISPFFKKAAGELHEGEKSRQHNDSEKKDARDFARENIKEARWFIKSINQRNLTLLKVSQAIVEYQRAFFTGGPKYLAPLTLKDIADTVSLHITTVSRTANGKYMQTEWGIFELRYFFCNAITGTGSKGSRFSKEGVKQIIKEIIESEQTNLSDQVIVELLAERGIALARRTVAKYRNELDFGSSFDR